MTLRHSTTMQFWRYAVVICAVGCSDEPTGPQFPQLAGSYTFIGDFDVFPVSQASLNGLVTISQPDRDAGNLTFSGSVQLTLEGVVSSLTAFQNATVDVSHRIQFELRSASGASIWTFDGLVNSSGNVITGRHTLQSGSQSTSGDWSLVRQ